MSKLAKDKAFLDLSDYGRPMAKWLAQRLRHTSLTPIHVTYAFVVSGILAIACMLQEQFLAAGLFLILKSVLDAADGELSRVKQTPSYTGRYLDSIFDMLLNLAFVVTVYYMTNAPLWLALGAFVAIQLQGTLYNYYYVILRNRLAGSDQTSRVFETSAPRAMPGESQHHVDLLFAVFHLLYGGFDRLIYRLDRGAVSVKQLPNWFMTAVSLYGLGFQLLLLAVLLTLGLTNWILPFFVAYSLLGFGFVGIRKGFIPAADAVPETL
ncbi:MAG: CDP-alcohol phosphatidyltransferase, partial [Candidatus Melainabacteria bacterium HGW-Melainabacteria-1]